MASRKQNTESKPRSISSAKAFDALAEAYFAACADNDEPVLLTGLVRALGLSDKSTFYEYGQDPEFADSVKKALLRVEMAYEKDLRSGKNTTAAIFALKNFAWADKTTVDNNLSGGVEHVIRWADKNE